MDEYEEGVRRSGVVLLVEDDESVQRMLTQKEYALLLVLAGRPGQTLDAERLYTEVWNQPFARGEATLKRHLSSLRGSTSDRTYRLRNDAR